MRSDPKQDGENERTPRTEDFGVHRQMVLWLFAVTGMTVALLTIGLKDVDSRAEACASAMVAGDLVYKGECGALLSILPTVAAAGALGAFVSALRRLYAFERILPADRYALFPGRFNGYLIAYSSIPPLVGLIAATILYLVLAAGLGDLIGGNAFPKFECELGEGKCKQFYLTLKHWKPANATDYARAVVWGFAAGFSERMVPDILNKLGQKREDA